MSDETKANTTEEKKEVKSKKSNKKDTYLTMSISELRVELQKVKMDMMTGKEKNTSIVRKIKKQIARILTNENKK